MSGLTINFSQADAKKIAACMKEITAGVTESDLAEIVLPLDEPDKEKTEKPGAVMTSREIAEAFGKIHLTVFRRIEKFLDTTANREQAKEFRLTSFRIRQEREYPMYELTEAGCNLYYEWMKSDKLYKTVPNELDRFREAIQKRFHPAMKQSCSGFLLEGKPKSDYESYSEIFDCFITGPAAEGREIQELTQKFQRFYEVMREIQLKVKDSNKLECALFDVAIGAEMQGFIYGFKLFAALLSRHLPEM